MNQPAFYDNTLSYEDNYEKGPPIDHQNLTPKKRSIIDKARFLGFAVNVPFGIPPGPLLNSAYMKAAFSWGYDVCTYKTVRAASYPSHPFPNVLYVDTPPELHPDESPRLIGKATTVKGVEDISITNSFGVPSQAPDVWQADVAKALSYVGDGQLLILSFMGTVRPNQSQEAFIEDFVTAAKLSVETGAKVVEANLSCPNIGNEGLVCYNLDVTETLCAALRVAIGDTPLILKVGYYKNEADLKRLAAIANTYANAVAAINTLQVEVVDETGKQALPGPNRLRSGVCGASIKWAGVEMVKKLNAIRQNEKFTYEIVGIGGVMTPDDYQEYFDAGANLVQSATGAMWNPNLAYEIWQKYYSIGR